MNSSGIKRGLATAAVSALAVTGLPALVDSASAQTLDSAQAATAVTLYSQASGAASTKNDGVNSTIHLVAGAGADVKQVRFQYRIFGGTPQTITTVSRANGGFSAEWAPPANILGGIAFVEAVGLDAAGTALAGSISTASVTLGAGSEAVDIANAPGSEVGVFAQPYAGGKSLAGVSGTTSSPTAPSLSSPSGTGAATSADVFAATGDVRAFSGTVDLSGYSWSVEKTAADGTKSIDPDEAVIVATAGSDDAETVKLYKQAITTVTAKATPELVQGAATSTATVTVLDQKGKPVAGARVVQAGTEAFTNSAGVATFAGLAGTAAGTNYSFYVDTTATAGYQEADDFQRSVTVKSYTPAVASIAAASADGAAFDFDEIAAGDIKVTAKDQNGATTTITGLQGTWTIKPFDTKIAESTVRATVDAATGNVTFPAGKVAGTYTLNTWIEKDNTPGQGAGDLSATPLTVKAGEASIKWDAKNVQAQAGTSTTQKGSLALSDGTVLGGRTAAVTFTPAGGGNAKLATTQPAGTTRVSDTQATVKTAADGTFSVAVADVAAVAPAPQTSEVGDVLDASSSTLGITAADTVDLTVDFVDLAVKTVAIGAGTNLVDGEATPGRPVSYTVTVRNKDNELLKNAAVNLSLDHGFFTTYAATAADLKASPAAAENGLYGTWEDKGATMSAVTDANGQVKVTVAIGRDAGFDDDGEVDAKLTVKAGDVTNSATSGVTTFSSSDALNPGGVTVSFDEGQAKSLPKAQSGTEVKLDVFVKDQFGNLTDAAVSSTGTSTTAVNGQYTGDAASLTARNGSGDQKVTVTLVNAETNVWTDSDTVLAGFQAARKTGTKSLTDSKTVNWYAIDFAGSNYAITSNAQGDQLPGKTVIVTYTALDQNGNPIRNAYVDFFRSGPDDLQNGDSKFARTDDNGVATYVFQGAKEGTATVTAVLKTGSNGENAVAASTEETSIVFAKPATTQPPVVTPPTPAPAPAPAPAPTLRDIVAKLVGSSNGKKTDKVTVDAPSSAKGARVKLYRFVNGTRKQVAAGTLNSKGNKTFKVKDNNGAKATKYVAVVSATESTKGDTTSTKQLK